MAALPPDGGCGGKVNKTEEQENQTDQKEYHGPNVEHRLTSHLGRSPDRSLRKCSILRQGGQMTFVPKFGYCLSALSGAVSPSVL